MKQSFLTILTLFSATLSSGANAHTLNTYWQRPTLNSTELKNFHSYTEYRQRQALKDGTTDSSQDKCPNTQSYAQEIMDRLLSASNLEAAKNLTPPLSIWVSCKAAPANQNYISFGKIQVTGNLIQWLKSEDELAFVLAHELAHFTLGHDLENFLAARNTMDNNQEKSADEIGLEFMSRAGYDPRAGISAMRIFKRKYGDIDPSRTHGTPSERGLNFESEITNHRYPVVAPNKASIGPIKDELRSLR